MRDTFQARDQAAAGHSFKPCFFASHVFSTGAAAPPTDVIVTLLCGASRHDTLSCAGRSLLQVYSAFRLVKRAADAGKTVVVVNLGDTRAERSGLDVLKASLTAAGVEG